MAFRLLLHGPMKVLVVDNEPEIVDLLTYWLESHGSQVVSTASGLCAAGLAQKEKCDVVLLDIMLPDASGLSILPEILQVSPSSKVIVMSAVHRELWKDHA